MLDSPGGAAQQNAGAAQAVGDWLWFLHADTQLAQATLPALAQLYIRGEAALGYFDLRFLDDGPPLTCLNAPGVWSRSRWLKLPFGDQGLVMPRALFHASVASTRPGTRRGPPLVWRVRRAGVPLGAVGAPV